MIKLKVKQKRILKQVVLHLTVIAMLCVWFVSMDRTAALYPSGIVIKMDKVEGEKDLITQDEVNHLVTKELPNDVMMQPISRLNLSVIENMLNADSRVFRSEVYVDIHHNLVIDVIQRRPVMRVMNITGDQFYVDQGGKYVQKGSQRATRVPVITGHVEKLDPELSLNDMPNLKIAFQIVNEVRADVVLKALIEQVHFEKSGRIVLIPKIGKEKIVLDHSDQIKDKLSNLKDFYKQLAKTNAWGKYDEIDISYHNQIVGRNLEKP